MLKTLHSIQLKSFAVALLIFAALQFGNWFLPVNYSKDLGTLSDSFNQFNLLWLTSYLIKLTLVIFGGIVLQNTVIQNEIIYKNTALVFCFYLILNSIYPSLSYLSSFSVLSFISILVFREVVKFYNNADPNYLVFKVSILVGLGSLIHPSFAIAMLVVLFAFSRFQPARIRSIALMLLGFAFPWLLLATSSYLFPEIVHNFKITLFQYNFSSQPKTFEIIVLAIFLLIAAIATFAWIGNSQRNTVKGRRIIQTILFILALFGAIALGYFGISKSSIELATMPLSLVLAYYFTITKRMKLRNIAFFLMLASILFLRYKDLLML